MTVTVNHVGTVQIDQAESKTAEGLKEYENNIRFRLKRKGDVYNVSINDKVTAGLTLPGKGTFNEVRIGLPGGRDAQLCRSRPPLFGQVTSLEKSSGKAAGDPPPPPQGLREDFSKVTAGTLPNGWTASAAGNLAVQKSGDLADLELTNTALLADGVVLPKVDLKGDFFTDVEAVFPDQDTAVQLYFKGDEGLHRSCWNWTPAGRSSWTPSSSSTAPRPGTTTRRTFSASSAAMRATSSS